MMKVLYVIACIAVIEAVFIVVLIIAAKKIRIELFAEKLELKRLRFLLKSYSIEYKQEMKAKLIVTQKMNLKQDFRTDIQHFFTYKANTEQLYRDILKIYFPYIQYLENEYPLLKKNDILMIILIHIGYDNQKIAAIFDYSKRTIYKKRQIISKVLGVSSLNLEQKIDLLFS